jgi:hypothetical protein
MALEYPLLCALESLLATSNPPEFTPSIYLEFSPKGLSPGPWEKAQTLVRQGRKAVRQPFMGDS